MHLHRLSGAFIRLDRLSNKLYIFIESQVHSYYFKCFSLPPFKCGYQKLFSADLPHIGLVLQY